MANAFLARLAQAADLGASERERLKDLCAVRRDIPAKKYVLRDGDRMAAFPVILSGWAAQYQILRSGARQITRLLLPGDAYAFGASAEAAAIADVITLSPCEVAMVAHGDMIAAMAEFPAIAEAVRNLSCLENAVMASWIVNVGRRDALERMAHLICEVHHRMATIDAAKGDQLFFPLTQDDFADAVGLTPVHINRKLQQLRQEGLITLRSKQLTAHDLRELHQVAGFDSGYLRLHPRRPDTDQARTSAA